MFIKLLGIKYISLENELETVHHFYPSFQPLITFPDFFCVFPSASTPLPDLWLIVSLSNFRTWPDKWMKSEKNNKNERTLIKRKWTPKSLHYYSTYMD